MNHIYVIWWAYSYHQLKFIIDDIKLIQNILNYITINLFIETIQ